MKKLFTTVAMLVALAFGGSADAGHVTQGPLVEGRMVASRTAYCISADDARVVGEAWLNGNAAANTQIGIFSARTNAGILRCGNGEGRVTPIELVGQYKRDDGKVLNLIRVLAYGIEIEIVLMTLAPFVPVPVLGGTRHLQRRPSVS